MNLSPPEIHALFINAQRYCLGRSSYSVSEYCQIVRAQWIDIPQNTRNILSRDLNTEIDSDRPLGHDCDRREWIRLQEFMGAMTAAEEGSVKYVGTLKDLAVKTRDAQQSKYCVFRYCPDPLAGESANFGVAAFHENEIAFKFTDDWIRLKSFGRGEDVQFLQDFARRCSENPVKTFAKPVSVEWAEVMRLIGLRWMNSIQVTAPSGSLFSVDECLNEMSKALL